MKKAGLPFLFFVLLIFDTGYSFLQHYHKSLDGDLSSIVLGYPEVMSDPFGISALVNHKVYGGTNRFFAHWMMSAYFKNVPLSLQNIVSPIQSIYLSCAIAKTVIQLAIILILSSLISGSKKLSNRNLLLSAILIMPLFQTNGYNGYMGIISSSITYTFFYALPGCLILLFILILFSRFDGIQWQQPNLYLILLLASLSFILCLGGPLTPAIILIGTPLIILSFTLDEYQPKSPLNASKSIQINFNKIPGRVIYLLGFIWLLSAYSLFIGRFNAENFFNSIPLAERYSRLPAGLYYIFTRKLGMPMLIGVILLNFYLVRRNQNNPEAKKILQRFKWLTIFIIIYIAILPLGGYRQYRENIIRSDTFLPVLLCLFYLYGISTFHLIKFPFRFRTQYVSIITVVLIAFTMADVKISKENVCEINALEKIAASTERIINIDNPCTIMSWNRINDYRASELNCDLLQRWQVTNEKKFYYQQ